MISWMTTPPSSTRPELHQRSVCFGANRGMTSINAALQVDLTGQCASESVGPRQISGSGGQVDTAVGAQMAPGASRLLPCAPPTLQRTGHGGAASPVPYTAGTAGGGRGDPYPEQYPLCGHRVWRGLFAGLTVPQRAKALSPSPTRTFGIGWRRSFTASTACDGPSVCGNRERPRNRRVPGR